MHRSHSRRSSVEHRDIFPMHTAIYWTRRNRITPRTFLFSPLRRKGASSLLPPTRTSDPYPRRITWSTNDPYFGRPLIRPSESPAEVRRNTSCSRIPRRGVEEYFLLKNPPPSRRNTSCSRMLRRGGGTLPQQHNHASPSGDLTAWGEPGDLSVPS